MHFVRVYMNRKNKITKNSDPPTIVTSPLWETFPWSQLKETVQLRVRVTPRGGKDEIDGVAQLSDLTYVLKIRTKSVPQDGEANDAVSRLIAHCLNIPRSKVQLVSGSTSRIKLFELSDVSLEHIEKSFLKLTGFS